MKFGKFIQEQAEDWATAHYLNYKGLKKILKEHSADTRRNNSNSLKTAFFFSLERELEKVNRFYLQKEAEFKLRLDSLFSKTTIEVKRYKHAKINNLNNLVEALQQFQLDLSKLQNFVELNATGFRKILKKYDKLSKSNTKEVYLSRQVEIQPCFNNDFLASMTDKADKKLREIEELITEINSQEVHVRENAQEDIEQSLLDVLATTNTENITEFISKRIPEDEKDLLSRVFVKRSMKLPVETLLLLLEIGNIDCNFRDDITDRTCLHGLASSGRLSVIQKCVEKGANTNVVDIYGKTPLHYASIYSKSDCVKFFLESVPVDCIDFDGNAPLIYSIRASSAECVKHLLEKGASISPITPSSPVPLSVAAQVGNFDILTLLFEKGAADTPDSEGVKAIHLAAREGHDQVISILIKNGSQVNEKDLIHKWTPLFYAGINGHLKVVEMLLSHGADITVMDENNWLPWTYALYHGHIAISKLLEVPNCIPPSKTVKDSDKMKPIAPSVLFENHEKSPGTQMHNLDSIPSLELPPPIIPFRIYGHNYLSNKHYIEISFPKSSPFTTHSLKKPKSYKINLHTIPEMSIPYSTIFPSKDPREVYAFQVSDYENTRIIIDIYPVFGSNIIGRGVIVPRNHTGGNMMIPIFDGGCEFVGEVECKTSIIEPFIHPGIEIGGKIGTYWKATDVVNSPRSGPLPKQLIATSLASEYLNLSVNLTKDGVPVIGEHVNINENFSIPVEDLNYPDILKFRKPINVTNYHHQDLEILGSYFRSSVESLDTILSETPTNVPMNIIFQSCKSNTNASQKYVDKILHVIYNHAEKGRNMIFSSKDMNMCTILNWKQPNHGVFFSMDIMEGIISLKDAIYIAKRNQLLGLMVNSEPFVKVPMLGDQIRESGLLLCPIEGSSNVVVRIPSGNQAQV